MQDYLQWLHFYEQQTEILYIEAYRKILLCSKKSLCITVDFEIALVNSGKNFSNVTVYNVYLL